MPNAPLSQNTSFIPKQGSVKRTKQTATRQIHLLTVFAYIFFATTLLTAFGLFLFNSHLDTQLDNEVKNLNAAISSFSDADMERVREFNIRLWQTKDRLEHAFALSSVFESIEAATSRDVMFDTLSVERDSDQGVTIEAKMITGSFDSALFQRGVLERDNVVESIVVDDVKIITEEDEEDVGVVASGVSFVAKLVVPLSAALVNGGVDNTVSSEVDTDQSDFSSLATTTEEAAIEEPSFDASSASTTGQATNQEIL